MSHAKWHPSRGSIDICVANCDGVSADTAFNRLARYMQIRKRHPAKALPMTTRPDLTIIVHANGQPYGLRRALASIGDNPRAEIVVIDDRAAEDDGDAHPHRWLSADPRLLVLRGERQGRAQARNLGIAAARAPLVAFLDTEDVWYPGKLGPQRALHAGHPGIGFSFTDATLVNERGSAAGTALGGWPRFRARHQRAMATAFLLGSDAFAQIRAENVVTLSTVVARADLLRDANGFATDLGDAAEWDLWLRLACLAPVACVPAATAMTAMGRPAPTTRVPEERLAEIARIAARQLHALAGSAWTGGIGLRAAALRLGRMAVPAHVPAGFCQQHAQQGGQPRAG